MTAEQPHDSLTMMGTIEVIGSSALSIKSRRRDA
jgi:hypothetical protein